MRRFFSGRLDGANVGDLLHVNASLEANRVLPGEPCQFSDGLLLPGITEYALRVGGPLGNRAAQGESPVATTLEGDIEIAIIAIDPGGTQVCAIGASGTVAIGARAAPVRP